MMYGKLEFARAEELLNHPDDGVDAPPEPEAWLTAL